MVEALQFLLSGLVVGSIYGLVGVGFTGIYNVTGIVNFAQGDFAVVGAMTAIALNFAGMPLLPAALLAIAITCALAALIERTAYGRFARTSFAGLSSPSVSASSFKAPPSSCGERTRSRCPPSRASDRSSCSAQHCCRSRCG